MVSNIIAIIGVGLAGAFLIFVPLVTKYITPWQAIPPALLVMAICMVATPFISSSWIVIIAGLFGAIGYGLSYSGLIGLMSISAADEHQGSIMGMAGAIAAATAGTSGIFFGLISDSASAPIFSAAGFTFIAYFLMLRLKNKTENV